MQQLFLALSLGLLIVPLGAARALDAVAPDGASFAYCRPAYDADAEPISNLYVRSLDGAAERLVCRLPGRLTEAIWVAPDRIAVTDPTQTDSYLMVSPGGRRLADVALPAGYSTIYKALSPDGRRIAFIGSHTADGSKEHGLFVCDLQTGVVTRLIDKAVKTNAAWSPDSRRLAIGVGRGYTRDYPLWIVDADGGAIEDTKTLGVGAAWSPDGRYIACTTQVAAGGSWTRGVPMDGKLGIYDVAAHSMRIVKDTDGAILPAWPRDGTLIAYLAGQALYTVAPQGGAPRKILDKADTLSSLAWQGDRAMVVTSGTSVTRVDVAKASAATLATWTEPSPPPLRPADYKTVALPRVTVRFARFDRKYAEACARILSEALACYERRGYAMPAAVTMEAAVDPGDTRLWTDGASRIYLRLGSKELLRPSTQTGVFNIYGMCHELGHDAMYANLGTLMGLPAGVGEGWAHYAGSVVVSEVAAKLGKDIWPEPYDIGAVEGLGRLQQQAKEALPKGWDQMDPTTRAALVFYRMDTDYGRDKLAAAMTRALARRPAGKDLMQAVVAQLRAVTGDPKAADWAPAGVLVPRVEWQVKVRRPDEAFFADERTARDASGVELAYDRGKMGQKLSSAGAGYAVLFRAPAGRWRLDGLRAFGARYGEAQPPKEDFSVYVCDADFRLLHTIRLPYARFGVGPEKWHTLRFDPVDVPRVFYVCVDFNATADKGVYVGQDTTVASSHSRFAMPYSYVQDLPGKADWMIRPHLQPAP